MCQIEDAPAHRVAAIVEGADHRLEELHVVRKEQAEGLFDGDHARGDHADQILEAEDQDLVRFVGGALTRLHGREGLAGEGHVQDVDAVLGRAEDARLEEVGDGDVFADAAVEILLPCACRRRVPFESEFHFASGLFGARRHAASTAEDVAESVLWTCGFGLLAAVSGFKRMYFGIKKMGVSPPVHLHHQSRLQNSSAWTWSSSSIHPANPRQLRLDLIREEPSP